MDIYGDGFPNIIEVNHYGTDPLIPDAATESIGDGLSNVAILDFITINS